MIRIIVRKPIRHPNDRSFTYAKLIFPGYLHRYLKLPGNYEFSCQTTILTRDMRKLEMDWLLYVSADNKTLFRDMLINVEQETKPTGEIKMEAIVDYRDYSKTLYGLPLLSVIITSSDPEKSVKCFKTTESDMIKPMYIYISLDEIEEKLNKLNIKVKTREKLDEDETLDLAFLPMFAPGKDEGKWIVSEICNIYANAEFENMMLQKDIVHILEVMINKYFDNPKEKEELFKMTIDEIREDAIYKLLEPERKEIEKLKEENREIIEVNREVTEANKRLTEEYREITEKLAEKDRKSKQEKQNLLKTYKELHKNGKIDKEALQLLNATVTLQ